MPNLSSVSWALIGLGAALVLVLIALVVARAARREQVEEQRIRRSQTLRVVLVFSLLTLIGIFAGANAHSVAINWVISRTQAPLFVVVGLAGGIGFLIGLLVAYRSRAE